MRRSPLLMAFGMSIALHLEALAVESLMSGFLRAPALLASHAPVWVFIPVPCMLR